MDATLTLAEIDAAVGDDALCARQVAMLAELAQTGLRIARALAEQVETAIGLDGANTDAARLERLSLAYDRAARAVRLSILLQDRLRASAREVPTVVAERKTTVQRIVGRIGDRQGENLQRLLRQTGERLDRDFGGDILTRPLSELVQMICNDLDLTLDWKTLAEEAWVQEELASKTPGWPLEGLAPKGPRPGATLHAQDPPH